MVVIEAVIEGLFGTAMLAVIPAWITARERGVSLWEEMFGDEN